MSSPWLSAVLVAACVSVAFNARASDEQRLGGAAIRDLVEGKRIYLATPLGGELPLSYRPDGRVDGTGEAIGLGRFLKPRDVGRWWIAGDRLCQQWESWYSGAAMCFRVVKIGARSIRWIRDNGETGVARVGS